MNSLVGYGVSSDSDSDVEDVNNGTSGPAEKEEGDGAVKKTRNFLLESDSASSDSESEDEEPKSLSSATSSSHPYTPASFRQPTQPPAAAPLQLNKLPSPPLNACSDSSVFTNPFKVQADQRLSALQKHVPLTMQAKPSQIGGKRMCVSYRKDGRCRFGIKCKFAHDSDLQTPVVSTDCHPPESEETPEAGHVGGGSQSHQREEEELEGQQVKKRRVGLSNTLIPPKRAMKQYGMQRERERINMS